MAKTTDIDPGARNHIAAGTTISGDIETNGDIRIDGTLKGSINSKGKLVIGSSGHINGEVYCINANISGQFKGDLRVKELLSLQASAKLEGEIQTEKISVEQGATINGNLKMGSVKDFAQSQSQAQNNQQNQKQRSA